MAEPTEETQKDDFKTGFITIPDVSKIIKDEIRAAILKQNNSTGMIEGEFLIEHDEGYEENGDVAIHFSCTIKGLRVDYMEKGSHQITGEIFINPFTKYRYLDVATSKEI